MHINGFSIEDKDLPSNVFYNIHKPPEYNDKVKITGEFKCEKETIKSLEADQQELYRLFKMGKMESYAYQEEWQMLENQIKAIKEENKGEKRGE